MSEVKNQTEGKEVTTVTDDEIAGLIAQNSAGRKRKMQVKALKQTIFF